MICGTEQVINKKLEQDALAFLCIGKVLRFAYKVPFFTIPPET